MALKLLLSRMDWWMAGLLGFLLPFSSFPLVGKLMSSSMVAPFSVLPMLFLVAFCLAPFLLRGGSLPPQVLPLFGFVGVALLSAAAAFFLPFPPYRDSTLLRSEAEALATLGVGLCFFLVIVVWVNHPDRLRFLLRWVNWGAVLMLSWSAVQLLAWNLLSTYPEWMWQIQGRTVTAYLLYTGRVTGFAYEPSWMAHQLNMLYLPAWLAATVTGFSAHRFRLWKFSLENLLLVLGVAALFFTVSRIGLLTFLLTLAYMLLLWNIQLVRWLQKRLLLKLNANEQRARFIRRWFTVLGVVVLLLVYAGLLLGSAYGLSHFDPRMQRIFDFSALREGSLLHYANQLVFAERLVFWQAGWEVFNDYPVLGAGPGNAGYFFPEKLSAFSWALPEVRILMYRWTALPNIKSLWVRLLAETGIIGFAMFVSFCYLLWKSAQFLARVDQCVLRSAGLAGSFVLIGFLVEGFSIDTFALPYYWISFGLLTAACDMLQRPYPIKNEELQSKPVSG